MTSFINDLKHPFRTGNILIQIIIINVGVYLLGNILELFISNYSIVSFLSFASFPSEIITHPWTIITYMFYHRELWHMVFNLLWLYWVGKIFIEYYGTSRLLSTYILGGISGGLLFLLLSFLFNSVYLQGFLNGASAGVMAIVIAAAVIVPDYIVYMLFIGQVKLKYVAIFAFIFTSLIDLQQNTGGKIAHIGGALYGYLFAIQFKNGKDFSKYFNQLFYRIKDLFTGKKRMKVVYTKAKTDEQFNFENAQKQKRTDEILDKISKSGYESLSKEEKDFLFKVSNDKK